MREFAYKNVINSQIAAKGSGNIKFWIFFSLNMIEQLLLKTFCSKMKFVKKLISLTEYLTDWSCDLKKNVLAFLKITKMPIFDLLNKGLLTIWFFVNILQGLFLFAEGGEGAVARCPAGHVPRSQWDESWSGT